MTPQIQVEQVGEKNGHPAFVVVIDGVVHYTWRDASDEAPHAPQCDGHLNGDQHGQTNE
jgi:hypothetical protein